MTSPEPSTPALNRIQRTAWVIGGIASLLAVWGWVTSPVSFYQSYLFAYVFWIGIGIGSTEVLMLHHLVSGYWGLSIRRLLEAGSRSIWLMVLLFFPLVFGIRHLYQWAQPNAVAKDAVLQQQRFYSNIPFFFVRMGIYFAVWIVFAYLLNKWSADQDRTGDPALRRRFQAMSGPGLVLYGLTVTFAFIDLVMSLEPHWSSTIYGMIFIVGEVLTTLAFMIIVAMILMERKPLANILSPRIFHDLGNLLLTFVILWAYLAVSQLIIMWSGNLQDEIPWYLRRTAGGWAVVAVLLGVFHFAVPFLLLLSRHVKRQAQMLAAVAALVLIMHVVNDFWLVLPALRPHQAQIHWTDFATIIGLGGLWIGVFAWHLKGRPLVPVRDPNLSELQNLIAQEEA